MRDMKEDSHRLKQEAVHDRRDYDSEYQAGAHWDKKEPSSNMPLFLAALKGDEQRILDAGCGGGRDAFFLTEKGFEVKGIDSSKVAISLAQQRAKAQGVAKANFLVGKIENLPFTDSEFDAIYSGYVLGGEELPKQIEELARVLRPQGVCYIAMFTRIQYEKPCERDEVNPKNFVIQSLKPYFELVEESTDIFSEEDEVGKHEHERLRLVLKKKD